MCRVFIRKRSEDQCLSEKGRKEAGLREKLRGSAVSTRSSADPQGALKRGQLPILVPSWGKGARPFYPCINHSLDGSSPGRGLTVAKATLLSQLQCWLIVEGHHLADSQ